MRERLIKMKVPGWVSFCSHPLLRHNLADDFGSCYIQGAFDKLRANPAECIRKLSACVSSPMSPLSN